MAGPTVDLVFRNLLILSPRSFNLVSSIISLSTCRVARPEEIIVFLGCPIGVKIPSSKEDEFLMDKVKKGHSLVQSASHFSREDCIGETCLEGYSCIPYNDNYTHTCRFSRLGTNMS